MPSMPAGRAQGVLRLLAAQVLRLLVFSRLSHSDELRAVAVQCCQLGDHRLAHIVTDVKCLEPAPRSPVIAKVHHPGDRGLEEFRHGASHPESRELPGSVTTAEKQRSLRLRYPFAAEPRSMILEAAATAGGVWALAQVGPPGHPARPARAAPGARAGSGRTGGLRRIGCVKCASPGRAAGGCSAGWCRPRRVRSARRPPCW